MTLLERLAAWWWRFIYLSPLQTKRQATFEYLTYWGAVIFVLVIVWLAWERID